MAKDHPICTISDCNKRAHAKGWCSTHHMRWLKHGDPLALKRTPNGEPQRFFREVVLTHERDECLIWPYALAGDGYGVVYLDGERCYVHRKACEAKHGPAPTPEHEAAHGCGKGTQGCVNQHHLRWATHAENQQDKIGHGTNSAGERNGKSKLTESHVVEIVRLLKTRTQKDLGEAFGVSRATINDIVCGRTWQHITGLSQRQLPNPYKGSTEG